MQWKCNAKAPRGEDAKRRRRDSNLYANNPAAKALSAKALAVLVFPDVLKGGQIWGAETGNGVLWQNGRTPTGARPQF